MMRLPIGGAQKQTAGPKPGGPKARVGYRVKRRISSRAFSNRAPARARMDPSTVSAAGAVVGARCAVGGGGLNRCDVAGSVCAVGGGGFDRGGRTRARRAVG